MLNGLDLFSGKGGFAKALEPWVRVVTYCEKDQFARSVLLSLQASGHIPVAPIWDDIRTLRGSMLPPIDAISGGSPCQDLSVAGARAGLGGKRSGLFWEFVRLTKECSPLFVFWENVAGARNVVPTVRAAFEELGFQVRDGNLSAQDVGAPHRRERIFLIGAHSERIKLRLQSWGRGGTLGQDSPFVGNDGQAWPMAHTNGKGQLEQADRRDEIRPWTRDRGQALPDALGVGLHSLGTESSGRTEIGSSARNFPDSDSERLEIGQSQSSHSQQKFAPIERSDWWVSEPDVGRVVDGFANKLARARHVCELHTLGNGLVPLQARTAFTRLLGIEAAEGLGGCQ